MWSTPAPLLSARACWFYYAAKKQDLSLDELAKWVEENKLRFAHWFTVDDLVYLKRGGRISGATAAIATILNIKPVMHVDNEGYLVAVEKVQGRKKSLRALFEHMENTLDQQATHTVFIGHCDAKEDAEYVAALVHEKYPDIMLHIDDHRHEHRRAFRPRNHRTLLYRQRAVKQNYKHFTRAG